MVTIYFDDGRTPLEINQAQGASFEDERTSEGMLKVTGKNHYETIAEFLRDDVIGFVISETE